jgi:hypothetical protein
MVMMEKGVDGDLIAMMVEERNSKKADGNTVPKKETANSDCVAVGEKDSVDAGGNTAPKKESANHGVMEEENSAGGDVANRGKTAVTLTAT